MLWLPKFWRIDGRRQTGSSLSRVLKQMEKLDGPHGMYGTIFGEIALQDLLLLTRSLLYYTYILRFGNSSPPNQLWSFFCLFLWPFQKSPCSPVLAPH